MFYNDGVCGGRMPAGRRQGFPPPAEDEYMNQKILISLALAAGLALGLFTLINSGVLLPGHEDEGNDAASAGRGTRTPASSSAVAAPSGNGAAGASAGRGPNVASQWGKARSPDGAIDAPQAGRERRDPRAAGDGGTSGSVVAADASERGDAATRGGAPASGGAGAQGPLTARGTAALVVEVVNNAGEACPGHDVQLRSTLGRKVASTGENGIVTFEDLPSGRYTLGVSAQDGTKGSTAGIDLAAGEYKRVTLRAGASEHVLHGRALDTDGVPLAGVHMELSMEAGRGDVVDLWTHAEHTLRTRTDAQGFWEIGELPSGIFRVVATWDVTRETRRRNVTAPSTVAVDFEFQAARVVVISGTCSDPDGHAVSGVVVSVVSTNPVSARTDGAGYYELETVWAETVFLRAMKPGYRRAEEVLRLTQAQAGSGVQADFKLTPASGTGVLEGLLTDTEGAQVAGETVLLTSAKVKVHAHTRSGPDGRFAFTDLEASDDFGLSVFPREKYKDLRVTGIVVSEDAPSQVELVLEPSELGIVEGVLLDGAGRPLAGFAFRIRSAKSWSQEVRVVTGPDGTFSADGVPAGDLMFDTSAAPHYSVRGVSLAPGESVRVNVTFGLGDGEVQGTVTGEDGRPQAGARVILSWRKETGSLVSSVQHSTAVDQSGWYRLQGLAPGTYHVEVRGAGGAVVRQARTLSDSGQWDFTIK